MIQRRDTAMRYDSKQLDQCLLLAHSHTVCKRVVQSSIKKAFQDVACVVFAWLVSDLRFSCLALIPSVLHAKLRTALTQIDEDAT